MSKAKDATQRPLTAAEKSEEMRRRIMCRWLKQDPTRNKPTAAAIELVKHACAMGATVGGIIQVLDISEHKFHRFMRESEEFAAAVKAGRQIEHDALVDRLVQVALEGNVAALCFALKSRHNYVDKGDGNATVIQNKVEVTFQLPDSLSPEMYLKTLTAQSEVLSPSDAERALAKPGVKKAVLKTLTLERSEEISNGQN